MQFVVEEEVLVVVGEGASGRRKSHCCMKGMRSRVEAAVVSLVGSQWALPSSELGLLLGLARLRAE